MDIVFMGTPQFAVPSLTAMSLSRHTVKAVVTGPDVQKGRGRKIREPAVKALAKELGIPVIQPESLKSEEFAADLRKISPDIFVVVAFRILPKSVIEIPQKGAINLHASLLPKYRGAAPINWAVIKGEKETGVTIFQIKPKVDTGDVLLQRSIGIESHDTAGSLSKRLSEIGAESVLKVLDGLECNTLKPLPQDDSIATKAPKVYPELGEINWSGSAESIRNLIHGLSPSPGAYSSFRGRRVKFLRASFESYNGDEVAGTIVKLQKSVLCIKTGDGILLPLEMQLEGRKALLIDDFLRGFQGKVGEQFV